MDVVVEKKCYTGENASRDSFRIIGAYANHSVTAETVIDLNVIKTMFRSEGNRC